MKAVLFDLFETLVSQFDSAWTPPTQTKAQRLGVPEEVWNQHWRSLEQDWERGVLRHYRDALAALCRAAGVVGDPVAFAELEDNYSSYVRRTAFGPADAEVVAMLQELKSAGLRLAILTNANDLDTAPWSTHELSGYFDVFVASHEVGLRKPERAIYALACERLDVAPHDAVFVGDGGSDELRGAEAAGLEAIWCTWFLRQWPEGIRPNPFPGDGWRRRLEEDAPPFRRVDRPAELSPLLVR